MSQTRLALIHPSTETFIISPYNNSIQAAMTQEICNLTGMTIEEIGLHGHSAWLDRKSQKRIIVSRFDMNKITTFNKPKFGGNIVPEPSEAIQKLNRYFYFGDIRSYFYNVDEKANTIVIKWHPNLLLCYLTDTNLLDPKLEISHKIIQKDVDKKDDHVPAIMIVERSHCSTYENHYDPNDVEEYFELLQNKKIK